MQNVQEQKIKLEQKKNRLLAEETRLRLKERKMRTRHLIEIGGLIVKAGIDHLPINVLYGALLSLSETLNTNETIKSSWATKGTSAFNKEKKEKTALILKFTEQPSTEIRDSIRNYGLRWNKFRSEWYGQVNDVSALKEGLGDTKYNIEIIKA